LLGLVVLLSSPPGISANEEDMTPGAAADRALTLINQASGELGGMVIRKKLSRELVQNILAKLGDAQAYLREIVK
jgi:hypothetical protein